MRDDRAVPGRTIRRRTDARAARETRSPCGPAALAGRPVSGHPVGGPVDSSEEKQNLSRSNPPQELVSVVVTSDGRRVPVRLSDTPAGQGSLAESIRTIARRLLALFSGSRQEPGGRRR
jgi:hypothetical protein